MDEARTAAGSKPPHDDEEAVLKVLALGRDTAPADDPRFPEVRPAEARRRWELYQQDVIREIYFRADRPTGRTGSWCSRLPTSPRPVR